MSWVSKLISLLKITLLLIFISVHGCISPDSAKNGENDQPENASLSYNHYNRTLDLLTHGEPKLEKIDDRGTTILPASAVCNELIVSRWTRELKETGKGSRLRCDYPNARILLPCFTSCGDIMEIFMSRCEEMRWNSLTVVIALNDDKIAEIELKDYPEWFRINIPPGTLKEGFNTLDFHCRGLRDAKADEAADKKITEMRYFRLDEIRLGHNPELHRNNFVSIGRISLDKENRPALVFAGGGCGIFRIPDKKEGKICFKIGYPVDNYFKASLTIQGLKEDGTVQTLKYIETILLPDTGWLSFNYDLPEGYQALKFQTQNDLAVASLSFAYRDSQEKMYYPDILLISVDTLRADHTGIQGDHRILTPFIDSLADKGFVFFRAYSQAAVTNPSHASLLTGMYLRQHNVLGNKWRLSSDATTLMEILKQNGYRTIASAGARHMSGGDSGFGQGSDVYYGTEVSKRDGRDVAADLSDELQKQDERPLFVFLHLFDPHVPYLKNEFSNYYSPREERLNLDIFRPTRDFDENKTRNLMAMYRAEICDADRYAGNVFRLMRKCRGDKPLLVVLTADHGESLYEHGLFFQHHTGLYEPHVRVPLIFFDSENKWPKGCSGIPVEMLNIFHTLISRLGLECPASASGIDLFPQNSLPERKSRNIHAETGSFAAALWRDDQKIICPIKEHPDFPQSLLFNLREDPLERYNLADQNPEKLKQMTNITNKWIKSSKGSLKKEQRILSAGDEASLKALGYLE